MLETSFKQSRIEDKPKDLFNREMETLVEAAELPLGSDEDRMPGLTFVVILMVQRNLNKSSLEKE